MSGREREAGKGAREGESKGRVERESRRGSFFARSFSSLCRRVTRARRRRKKFAKKVGTAGCFIYYKAWEELQKLL